MNRIHFIIVLLFLSFFGEELMAQSVTITPEHTSGSCADYIVTFDGSASSVATSFNFNGGVLPSGWSTSPYTITSTICGPSFNTPDNSNYFWATDLGTVAPYVGKRYVQTNAVNVTSGGTISFKMLYGNGNVTACEQPDLPEEEVWLQYSTDGSSWTTIYDGWETSSTNAYAWYNWYSVSLAIPAGAQTSSTYFRWYQASNSGDCCDNWGLEDVSIGTNITPSSYTWTVDGTTVGSAEDLTYTFSTPGTYTIGLSVLFSDGSTRNASTSYQVLSNQNPTINSISNLVVAMNAGQQTVSLSGITDGDGCLVQSLSLGTGSNNTTVIPTPTFTYTSDNSTGSLYFTPSSNQVGNVTLTVTVNDNATGALGGAKAQSTNFNVYVNDYPTTPGAFTLPTGSRLNIDYTYNIAWGASTDMTAGVTYQLEYMLNGGGWSSIGSGLGSNTYNNWNGHQSPALVGRTVQFRVRAYDGTYYSGYTYSSTFDIVDNTPPVANNDTFLRFYTDNQISYTFAAPGVLSNDTDVDGDAITVGTPRPVANVSNGTLVLNANGSFTYTPSNGYKDLNDSFTYYAYDGQENSNSVGTVTIQVLTPRFTNASGDGDFNNPLNWNCGYVPTESLNVIIASGQTMEINQNYTCKNLKFESGASFICTGGHTLTITGNVLRSDNSVAIQVASSLVVTSSLQIKNL